LSATGDLEAVITLVAVSGPLRIGSSRGRTTFTEFDVGHTVCAVLDGGVVMETAAR